MLSKTTSSVTYQGNGVTTVFPYSFEVQDAAHLVVRITDNTVSPPTATTLTSGQYTATGIGGDESGGNVTYAGLPTGKAITISRVVPYKQLTSIPNQGGFFPEVVEKALDYLTMQLQQLAASDAQAVKLPAGSGMTAEQYINAISAAVAAAVALNSAITGGIPLSVANGGTGSSSAAGARTALGLTAAWLIGQMCPALAVATGFNAQYLQGYLPSYTAGLNQIPVGGAGNNKLEPGWVPGSFMPGGLNCMVLPHGQFIQWGLGPAATNNTTEDSYTITFPVSFPTACQFALVSNHGSITFDSVLQANGWNASTLTVVKNVIGAGSTSGTLKPLWLAIGN